MRYAKLSCTEFYSCYLQQCHTIATLIGLLAMARRVIWIRSVRPSVQKFSWNWLFSFFRELNVVLGVDVVLCMTKAHFLKKMFYPQNGENRSSPGFFECIGKFSFFLSSLFFISVVYNESLYYCNSCMLEQISYLGKFWFLRYGPKCSWPIRLQDFSINCRTLKLAVSHKEVNEINRFLVCPSNGFLRNGSLGFSHFWHNGR